MNGNPNGKTPSMGALDLRRPPKIKEAAVSFWLPPPKEKACARMDIVFICATNRSLLDICPYFLGELGILFRLEKRTPPSILGGSASGFENPPPQLAVLTRPVDPRQFRWSEQNPPFSVCEFLGRVSLVWGRRRGSALLTTQGTIIKYMATRTDQMSFWDTCTLQIRMEPVRKLTQRQKGTVEEV